MIRKIIKIRAEDFPNVRLAFAEMGVSSWKEYQERKAAGTLDAEPSGEALLPGPLTWQEYLERRMVWDAIRQAVGLDAEYYAGAEVFLFPEAAIARALAAGRVRKTTSGTRYMGVDPAEGGDNSSWVIGDDLGVVKVVSEKTPDTNVIFNRTLDLMRTWGLQPGNVCFDRGGGGKQHADRLRDAGYAVRAVTFSEMVRIDIKSGMTPLAERKSVREDQTVYKSRRVEMYWEAALLFPVTPEMGSNGAPTVLYSLNEECNSVRVGDRKTLIEQLALIPKEYDKDGRPYLRPKNRNPGQTEKGLKTLTEIIGHSPDEADAFVLMNHARTSKPIRSKAEALGAR